MKPLRVVGLTAEFFIWEQLYYCILLYFREKEEGNPAYELHVMARSEMQAGRYNRARECCVRALHLSEDLCQPYSQGTAHMLLGTIDLDQGNVAGGDLKNAQEHFLQAVDIFEHAGRRHEKGVALLALGWVLLDHWVLKSAVDRTEEVFRHYQEASGIFGELNSDLVSEANQRLLEEATCVLRECLDTVYSEAEGLAEIQQALALTYAPREMRGFTEELEELIAEQPGRSGLAEALALVRAWQPARFDQPHQEE